MDSQGLINKLNKLKVKIQLSRDNKERVMLVNDYLRLVDFLEVSTTNDYNKQSQFLENFSDRYIRYGVKEQNKYIKDCMENLEELIELNNKLLEIMLNYPLIYGYEKCHCDKKSCEDVFKKLINLDQSIKKSYHKIEKNIYISNQYNANIDGFCSTSNYVIEPLIYIEEPYDNMDLYFSLSHEFGHAYDCMLTSTLRGVVPTSKIYVEFASIFFEHLYESLIPNNSPLEKAKNHYNVNSCTQNLDLILGFDLINLSKLNKEEIECDEYGVFDVDYNKYLNNYNQRLLKTIEFYKRPSFYKFSYIIGEVISNNLFKYYDDNYSLLLKEFRNFLMNAQSMSVSEVIKEFCDVEATREKVEKIYNAQKKEYHLV